MSGDAMRAGRLHLDRLAMCHSVTEETYGALGTPPVQAHWLLIRFAEFVAALACLTIIPVGGILLIKLVFRI